MVELGALLATGGGPGSYERCVAEALAAGVTAEEVVDLLVTVAPTIGLARLVSDAIDVARALGYDVDHALEVVDEARDMQPEVS